MEEIRKRQHLLSNLLNVGYLTKKDREHILEPYDINLSKLNILELLLSESPDGLSQMEIKGRLVDKTLDLPRILWQLETNGFITRYRSQKDKPKVLITVTPKGEDLLKQIGQQAAEMNKTVKVLTGEEVERMQSLLQKMMDAIAKAPDNVGE